MLKTLTQVDLQGKRVLLRAEFNVPILNNKISDDLRIRKSLPTIKYLLEHSAKIIICSHLGRPNGEVVEDLRLNLVKEKLESLLDRPVKKLNTIIGKEVETEASKMKDGDIILLENIRFHPGERHNDIRFSKELAGLADIFVSDAFGVLHRAHASTVGIASYLPSYAGFLVQKEIEALSTIFKIQDSSLVMIVGGSKMKTKVRLIENFLEKSKAILIGGGIANTFLAAKNIEIGSSICDKSEIQHAKKILELDTENKIILPSDVVVSDGIYETAPAKNISINEIGKNDKILDIGTESQKSFQKCIDTASNIVWNGPLGVNTLKQFAGGTKAVADALANSKGKTYVGGGDTADAVFSFGHTEDQFTHISTGGGASLKFLEGEILPGIQVLRKNKI